MDKGRKGPWIFYVDEDAHDQFKAAYGDKLQAALSGVSHEFAVTYGALADSAPRKSSAIRSWGRDNQMLGSVPGGLMRSCVCVSWLGVLVHG